MLDAGGGAARSAGGQGQAAGEVHITSAGTVTMAPTWPLATPVDVPPVPAGAMVIAAGALGADVAVDGTIHLDGMLAATGSDPVRQITARGRGHLPDGNPAKRRPGRRPAGDHAQRPGGTVYIPGHLDTSGAGPASQAGGAIVITAARVVVTGTLSSNGGDSQTVGGAGGAITITATGDVVLAGKVRLRGGAAQRRGRRRDGGRRRRPDHRHQRRGSGGGYHRRPRWLRDVRCSGGGRGGGTGGAVRIGATTAPASVALLTSVSLKGGEGAAAGGLGGNFSVAIVGLVGDFTVAPGMEANVDGGACSGAGPGGGAGHLDFQCPDCQLSMAGKLMGRGGEAPGGHGGLGGQFHIYVDSNFDGVGGNLTIEADGLIDVSGGPGAIGGSARNDGTWDVAIFPEGIESIAVLLDSDNLRGTPTAGVTLNLGRIIAAVGRPAASGGDVEFHGKGLDGANDPSPGNVDSAADGNGMPGQVLME